MSNINYNNLSNINCNNLSNINYNNLRNIYYNNLSNINYYNLRNINYNNLSSVDIQGNNYISINISLCYSSFKSVSCPHLGIGHLHFYDHKWWLDSGSFIQLFPNYTQLFFIKPFSRFIIDRKISIIMTYVIYI